MSDRRTGLYLLAAVFVIAVCGLVYELIAAALSSYLLGGSVTQFSIVIGVFLTAMGIGSYLTRFVEDKLVDTFIAVQVGIAFSGGMSAAVLLLVFAVTDVYLPVLIAVLMLTGALVGMEIPLIIRIMRAGEALRVTVSNVLALDYLGALIASCAFPVLFVPYIGLLRTSFIFGLINTAVAAVGLRVLGETTTRPKTLKTAIIAVGAVLGTGLVFSGAFTSFTETLMYQDNIILTRQTPYQRLVVTRWREDLRLFIDGHLQFSTVDEHRYHESLVHPVVAACRHPRRALILGGGDGMTAREVLKHPSIEHIDLVDLDEEMISLFRDRGRLAELSDRALSNPKVSVHIDDAYKFLEKTRDSWDVILIDLPDPSNLSLGRLYTKSFYRLCGEHLAVTGCLATQATSPFYAPDAFWCIVRTLEETPLGAGGRDRFRAYPYHVHIPSFGDWGFVAATRGSIDPKTLVLDKNVRLKFLTESLLPTLFVFPKDVLPGPGISANRLDDQALVKYYRHGQRRFGP
ncbi:MAG: polyamine aminopropyltransferase [Pseudomonadota bacterium]